jgi:serine/threonine protein kinase
LEPNVFSNACDPIAKSVLKIDDDTCTKVQRAQIGSDIDWLWDYKGELQVISTTYYDGVHYTTHPLHFLPIINHLESLHSQGFVHGDIRAYNMVLPRDAANASAGKVDDGWLIDFDYGGTADIVKYPKGYKPVLADGVRPGKAGKPITIMDDWMSLFSLILKKYDFIPGSDYRYDDPEYGTKLSMLRDQLTIYYEIDPGKHVKSPGTLLREYLQLVSKEYTIKPEQSFMADMKDCGLWNNTSNTGKNVSGAATGTPKKDEW